MVLKEASEYFDIVTSGNVTTGEVKSRSDTHRDGDLHRSIHIWIIDSAGNVLLQKKSKEKAQRPGTWDLAVGGHVETGSEPIDAAVRECMEELGLRIKTTDLQYLFDINHEDLIQGWENPIAR